MAWIKPDKPMTSYDHIRRKCYKLGSDWVCPPNLQAFTKFRDHFSNRLACCRKGIGFPTSRDQENIEEPGPGVQKDHFDMLNAGCISRIFLHVSHFLL